MYCIEIKLTIIIIILKLLFAIAVTPLNLDFFALAATTITLHTPKRFTSRLLPVIAFFPLQTKPDRVGPIDCRSGWWT